LIQILTVIRSVTTEIENGDAEENGGAEENGNTERRVEDLEAQLRDAEAKVCDAQVRLHDFATVSGAWMFETDHDNRFTWMSDNVETITGIKPEWHYGKSRTEISDPAAMGENWASHLETLRRREPFNDFIFPRKGPFGTQWLKVSAIPSFNGYGEFTGYRGTGADITRQITAEKDAEKSRQVLALAIEGLEENFVLWGVDDEIVICNQEFREINAAFAHAAVPGTSFHAHIRAGLAVGAYPDAIGREAAWYRERLKHHHRPSGAIEIHRQDGRWILLHEQRMSDGSTVSISTDITRLKHIESLKDELVSTVSHELRTPLTAIIGALGLITSHTVGGDLSDDVQKLIKISEDNALRLKQLVDDLLDLDKLESGQMEFNFSEIDLNDLLETSININMPYARAFGVNLVYQAGDVAPVFAGDRNRLIQVLTNLISNACKFSEKGGDVEVVPAITATGVRVSVRDYGKGIAAEFRDHIFDRFSQADASDVRQTKGTGLGLAISKAIIERHSGELGFVSELGVGSTFYLDLPTTSLELQS